jgi:anionic cell wall polymer biosynthesis LytR-Cps2A-Psr (LCP) family protein
MPKGIKIFLITALSLIVIVALGIFMTYAATPARFNILIVGSDQRGTERARSDVLMVFSVPKSPSQSLSLITIPRDTRVEVDGFGTQKITHAYAFGDRTGDKDLGNIDLTKKTVEQFLDIPIHATAEFTFESFKGMVDFAGGVDTPDGHVDGTEALKIVRNRYREGGDFARTRDQRNIFLSLAQRLQNPSELKRFYSYIQQQDQTRLQYDTVPTWQFGAMAALRRSGKFDFANTHTDFIPGKGDTIYTPEYKANLYYWIPDLDATNKLVKEYLR